MATTTTIASDTSGNTSERVAQAVQLPSFLSGFAVQAILLALVSFIFYANTFKHEYALDDTAIILKNEFVHQGFTGIPDILTKDVYYSYFNQLGTNNQLTGGRYRPLSVVTFAIEQQLMGPVIKGQVDSLITYGVGYEKQLPYERKFVHEMQVRHVVNVLWYGLLVVVILYFLRTVVFPNQTIVAFVAALLFAVHPLHTEVVANVKSRDEIMSLFFICLTFIYAFRYFDYRKIGNQFMAVLFFILALLSKEYAITLVGLLPISFYVIRKLTIKESLKASIPYFIVAAIYLMIRLSMVGPHDEQSESDIQINPYAFASATEKLATEIATSLNYLKLLIVPHPLCSDYSYNQIPYKDFGSPVVWLSLLVHIGLVVLFIYLLKHRSILSIALGFYLFNLLMICNLVFDIGATMGERLIFHSSVGFAIVVAWLLIKGLELMGSVPVRGIILAGGAVVLLVVTGFKTTTRNKDWKNDETLFFQDINNAPNSFLVNGNVATMLVNQSDFVKDEKQRIANIRRGISLYNRVLAMQDNYVLGYMNRCIAFYKLAETDNMVADLDKVLKLYPIHPQLPEMYYRAGMLYYSKQQYEKASLAVNKAIQVNPREPALKKVLAAVDSAWKANR